ncbi:uncharacterized protein LOC128812401 [Vidua macroura]|uniref:uncharacterized protein LOC128812401 n=1 Tax=Vidua macroura TaxID=187451 RepID=UPI0023A8B73E|nr:uncharacterized protein LOC128812401 [Vidua macroura]
MFHILFWMRSDTDQRKGMKTACLYHIAFSGGWEASLNRESKNLQGLFKFQECLRERRHPLQNRRPDLCASFSLRVFHGWGIPPKSAKGAVAVPRRGAAKGSTSTSRARASGALGGGACRGLLCSLLCAADEKCSASSHEESAAVPEPSSRSLAAAPAVPVPAALLRLLLAAPAPPPAGGSQSHCGPCSNFIPHTPLCSSSSVCLCWGRLKQSELTDIF